MISIEVAVAAVEKVKVEGGKIKVILDHDAGVDDFAALLILANNENVDLQAVIVTPADGIRSAGMRASKNLLRISGKTHVPVFGATLHGINKFPLDWRLDSCKVDAMPILNDADSVEYVEEYDECEANSSHPVDDFSHIPPSQFGQDALAILLRNADEPITLVVVGPLTTLAYVLINYPEVASNIAEVFIMGGAVFVHGNVGVEPTAEWNIYNDPLAAAIVMDSTVPLKFFSLDATNYVPITEQFIRSIPNSKYHSSSHHQNENVNEVVHNRKPAVNNALGSIYALVSGHHLRTPLPYYAWDALTAFCLTAKGEPFCKYDQIELGVIYSSEYHQGRTISKGSFELESAIDGNIKTSTHSSFRVVDVFKPIDPNIFYQLCRDL